MADKLFSIGDGQSVKRYKDMGDGTWAEVVSVQSSNPIVVSSAAPNNADGRPDGTIYIQTAP